MIPLITLLLKFLGDMFFPLVPIMTELNLTLDLENMYLGSKPGVKGYILSDLKNKQIFLSPDKVFL